MVTEVKRNKCQLQTTKSFNINPTSKSHDPLSNFTATAAYGGGTKMDASYLVGTSCISLKQKLRLHITKYGLLVFYLQYIMKRSPKLSHKNICSSKCTVYNIVFFAIVDIKIVAISFLYVSSIKTQLFTKVPASPLKSKDLDEARYFALSWSHIPW